MEIRIRTSGSTVVGFWFCLLGAGLSAFVFWQSILAGLIFLAGWCGASMGICRLRGASVRGRLTGSEIEVSRGLFFKTVRRLPTRFISGVYRLDTPLLRRARASIVLVYSPAGVLLLPGMDAQDAARLELALMGGRP